MTNSTGKLYIGMDVHKDSIDLAVAEEGGRQEVRHYGKIGGDLLSLDQAVRKLRSSGKALHFVYEAGPCGYVIHRHLARQGLDCIGGAVADPQTQRRSGQD